MTTFFLRSFAPLTLLIAIAPAQGALPQQPAPDFSRFAPSSSAARQITDAINDQDRITLRGNVPGAVRAKAPLGFVDPTLPMEKMILSLKMSPDAAYRLQLLQAAQQDPKSPYFHKWLTPAQYGQLFGPSQADVDAIAGWLVSQGFRIDEVAAGRMSINFSGRAAQVQQAFRTTLRTFDINGETRHANATDPSIPAALSPAVNGVVSLNDIPRKSGTTHRRPLTDVEGARTEGQKNGIGPAYTGGTGNHYMSPGDFATIYNLKPLYTAGIDGTGQTIAIVGRSNINMSYVTTFRSDMGLPVNNPTVILNGTNPGVINGEEGEATLDVEWSGAVAKKAAIKFVVSKSTGSTDGVDLSAQYIVNHNTAPVMSTSFGQCEDSLGPAGNSFYNSLWQQAATQGITSCVSTGDNGPSGCDDPNSATTGSGLAISGLASTPYNIAVGGTEFNDLASPTTYWGTSNSGSGYDSAISFIPETPWNESAAGDNDIGGLWAGSGGVSSLYAKPSWQVAPGVPADAHRDIPDVALTAAQHDGYLVYDQDSTGKNPGLYVAAGTSAASPSFAGIMALVVQQMGGVGQGNANTRLYELGNAQYGSGGAAVFHDVTTGNNTVPGVTGFDAVTGYDLATGLGSVDANALVNNWAASSVSLAATTSTTVNVGGTVTFKGTSTFTPNTLTWTADGGSFSPTTTAGDGVATTIYTAPASIGSVQANMTITATGFDGTTTATALVTVIDPAQVTLSVSPSSTQHMFTSKTLAFSATVNAGNVNWTKTGGGSLSSASGLTTTLTAPATTGDVVLTATSTANGSVKQVVTIHVKSQDVNGDASVDVRDLLSIAAAYGTANAAADLDSSGTVDDADIALFLANF